jgi:hypothetical protein
MLRILSRTPAGAPRAHSGSLALLAAATLTAAFCADALAQSRWVIVNGQRMSDAQVAELARANCSDIPNGNYWLNTRSGAWVYAGNPRAQGVIGEGCGRGTDPGSGVNQDGTHGPFATLRRAEEFANGYRAQGLRAVAFHNGDGYYVRVSQ